MPVRRVASTPGSLFGEPARNHIRKISSDAALSTSCRDREGGDEVSLSFTAFSDLPFVALTGIESRVSRSGSVSSLSELSDTLLDRPDLLPFKDNSEFGGMTPQLLCACACATANAFLCGLNLGALNTSAAVMREGLGVPSTVREAHGLVAHSVLNDSIWGFCVSCLSLGALIGTLGSELIVSWRGPRRAIGLACALFLLSALLGMLAATQACHVLPDASLESYPYPPPPPASPPRPPRAPPGSGSAPSRLHKLSRELAHCAPALLLLVLSRMIAGVACGLCSTTLPTYLGELAPPHLRGSVGASVAVASALGVAAAHALGFCEVFATPGLWLWLLPPAVAAAISLSQIALIASRLLPESPRWLLQLGDVPSAATALSELRDGELSSEELAEELALMAAGTPSAACLAECLEAGGFSSSSPAFSSSAVVGFSSSNHSFGGGLGGGGLGGGGLGGGESGPGGMGGGRPSSTGELLRVATAYLPPDFTAAGRASPSAAGTAASAPAPAPGTATAMETPRLAYSAAAPSDKGDKGTIRGAAAADPTLAATSATMAAATEAAAACFGSAASNSDSRGSSSFGSRRQRSPPPGAIALCCAMMAAQQLSGVGFASSYSSAVFRDTGLSWSANFAAIWMYNVANVMVTAFAVRVLNVTGRRPLLVGSLASTAAVLVLLSAGLRLSYESTLGSTFGAPLASIALALHAAAFGVGVGPIPWLLPNELLDPSWHRVAARLTAATHWFASFFAAQTFLPLHAALGTGCLLPNAVVLLLAVVLAIFIAPETRGKTIDAIQKDFVRQSDSFRRPSPHVNPLAAPLAKAGTR